MSEQASGTPSLTIGSIAVRGRSASASGSAVAGRVGSALAQAAAGTTRSQRIEVLRIELPAGADEAAVARAMARALAGRAGL